jgi:CheY-like chemotaxis protein
MGKVGVAPLETSLRILLVDDIELNRMVAHKMLRRLGYVVDLASSGQETLSVLHHQTYDVVFMDIEMPDMDGLETTRCIRQLVSAKTEPWIIAMTACTMQGDRERCLDAGMNDYVPKPIERQTVTDALDRFQTFRQWPRQASTDKPLVELLDHSVPSSDQLLPAIDTEILHQLKLLSSGGDDLVIEVINSYLLDAPQRLQAIASAIAAGELVRVSQAAHAMRSLSASIGATQLANLCGVAESMARHQQSDISPSLLMQIQTEYDRVTTALSVMLRDHHEH